MSLSDELKAIKNKYPMSENYKPTKKYEKSDYCVNPRPIGSNNCDKCGWCGRKFNEKGELIEEVK